MSRADKRKTQDFGKRGGREEIAAVERKPTSMERLKSIGRSWWGKKSPQTKKQQPGARQGRSR